MTIKSLLNRNIPNLIFSYRRQFGTILFMMATALLFVVILRPFNIYEALDMPRLTSMMPCITSQQEAYWIALLTIVAVASVVVSISRTIMVRYNHYNKTLTYRWYGMWCIVEFIIVALCITISSVVLFHERQINIFNLFLTILGKASCILFMPYSIYILYIVIVDKTLQLKDLKESIDREETLLQRAYISFYDDRNEMRLSVKREDVILIESADNYICVWYMNNDTVKKCMIRNTMKRVAEQLEDSSIQRCHRSYMINMERVKVLRRDKDGIFIEFGIEGVFDVPISRTYIQGITSWLIK